MLPENIDRIRELTEVLSLEEAREIADRVMEGGLALPDMVEQVEMISHLAVRSALARDELGDPARTRLYSEIVSLCCRSAMKLEPEPPGALSGLVGYQLLLRCCSEDLLPELEPERLAAEIEAATPIDGHASRDLFVRALCVYLMLGSGERAERLVALVSRNPACPTFGQLMQDHVPYLPETEREGVVQLLRAHPRFGE